MPEMGEQSFFLVRTEIITEIGPAPPRAVDYVAFERQSNDVPLHATRAQPGGSVLQALQPRGVQTPRTRAGGSPVCFFEGRSTSIVIFLPRRTEQLKCSRADRCLQQIGADGMAEEIFSSSGRTHQT